MFQYKLRTDLQLGGDVNSIFIEILYNSYNSSNTKRNTICGCIYRPPQMSLHIFTELLSQMFEHENKYVYLVGDFNVNTLPHIKGTLATQEF